MPSVNTQHGSIDVAELGMTLIHEHVFNPYPLRRHREAESFTLAELAKVKQWGVQTIVDVTPYAKPSRFKNVLAKTDLNIISSVGFYLQKYIPPKLIHFSTTQLVTWLDTQVVNGVNNSPYLPGIIKLATRWTSDQELNEFEKRIYSAATVIQQKYKLPIATHSSCSSSGSLAQMKYLKIVGADLEHVVFFHTDKGLTKDKTSSKHFDDMLAILDSGGYVQFAEFGNKNPRNQSHILSIISELRNRGYIRQLFISADCYWKWTRNGVRFAGDHWGGVTRNYEYTFVRTIPLLRQNGFSQSDIDIMLISNPRQFFNMSYEPVQLSLF